MLRCKTPFVARAIRSGRSLFASTRHVPSRAAANRAQWHGFAINAQFSTFTDNTAEYYEEEEHIASAFGKSAEHHTDLRHPHEFYPLARKLKRKIFLHMGPTNSGKTHNAVLALKAAERGVFCGPLRLLAWEMFEKLNSQGVACDLLTGQEKQEVSILVFLLSLIALIVTSTFRLARRSGFGR